MRTYIHTKIQNIKPANSNKNKLHIELKTQLRISTEKIITDRVVKYYHIKFQTS